MKRQNITIGLFTKPKTVIRQNLPHAMRLGRRQSSTTEARLHLSAMMLDDPTWFVSTSTPEAAEKSRSIVRRLSTWEDWHPDDAHFYATIEPYQRALQSEEE